MVSTSPQHPPLLVDLTKGQRHSLHLNSINAGQVPKCLDEVNAAREAVGFSGFTQATQDGVLPTPEGELTDGDWKKMCEYLIPVSTQVKGISVH